MYVKEERPKDSFGIMERRVKLWECVELLKLMFHSSPLPTLKIPTSRLDWQEH